MFNSLNDINKALSLESTWAGRGDPSSSIAKLGKIAGQAIENAGMTGSMLRLLDSVVDGGLSNIIDKIVGVLEYIESDIDAQDLMDEIERLMHNPHENVSLKWIKLAAKSIDTIEEFVTQFKVPVMPIRDDNGTPTTTARIGESYSQINERKYAVEDIGLLAVRQLHVNAPMKSHDKSSVETCLIDVSGSMIQCDTEGFARLYMLNRIQHVRDGKLDIQFVLFGATERFLKIEFGGKSYDRFNKSTPPEVLDALENMVYYHRPSDYTTDLNSAIEFANKLRSKSVTLITDHTAKTTSRFREAVVNVICNNKYSSLKNLCPSKRFFTFEEMQHKLK